MGVLPLGSRSPDAPDGDLARLWVWPRQNQHLTAMRGPGRAQLGDLPHRTQPPPEGRPLRSD